MKVDTIYFFTATINQWKWALNHVGCKNILLDSFSHLAKKKAVKIFAFVIMPNHIHLIWKPLENETVKNLQLSFMKFTAQQIKFWLLENNPNLLDELLVNKKDRTYQIWKRNPLAVELYTPSVIEQKLQYLHNNPCQGKWMLSNDPISYPFSSASFYESGNDPFGFLSHYGEEI